MFDWIESRRGMPKSIKTYLLSLKQDGHLSRSLAEELQKKLQISKGAGKYFLLGFVGGDMNTNISVQTRTILIFCTLACAAGVLTLFLSSLQTVNVAAGDLLSEPYGLNDVTSERWKIFTDMEKTRGDPGVIAFNDKIYVMGGYFPSFFGYNQTQEVYDPQSDSWQYTANLPVGRSDMMVAAVGNEFYAIGGWNLDLGGALDYNHRYDPLLDNWITMTSMITPVSGAGVVVLTDTIHILGGFTGSNVISDVQIYDPATNNWSTGTPMSEVRSEFSAVLLNGKIYAVGGLTSGGITTSTVEIYDPVADLWTNGPPLPESRASMAVEVRQGNIYVVGGTDDWSGGIPQDTAFVLDPGLGVWSSVNPMPTARSACRSAVISDTLYVIGGVGAPGAPTANEAFGFLPITPTMTIESDNPDPSQINQPFTISYSVTATGEIPTGVVTVTVENRPESCSSALANGMGSCQLALNTLGTFTITSNYSGNHILLGSSDSESHMVVKSDTVAFINSTDPSPSLPGQQITVTYTITSPFGIPTGPVTVTATTSSAVCTGVLTTGTGNCSITLPSPGTYTLTADYGGDAAFNPSSDTSLHVVDPFRLFLPLTLRE